MWPDDEHSSSMISVILNDCAYSDVIVHAYLLCVYIFFLYVMYYEYVINVYIYICYDWNISGWFVWNWYAGAEQLHSSYSSMWYDFWTYVETFTVTVNPAREGCTYITQYMVITQTGRQTLWNRCYSIEYVTCVSAAYLLTSMLVS